MSFDRVTIEGKRHMIGTIFSLHPSWKPGSGPNFEIDINQKTDKLMNVDDIALIFLFQEAVTYFESPHSPPLVHTAT